MTLTLERRIECDGAFNLRDLGGYRGDGGRTVRWRTLFRADGLHRVRGDALSVVRDLRCRTVLDLRTSDEVGAGQYSGADVDVVHLPVLRRTWEASDFDDLDGDAVTFLAARYLDMAAEGSTAIATAFQVLASVSRFPVAFHCSAGKDRTGVLAALVLAAIGVDDEQVAADYALSARAMERFVARLVADRPELADILPQQPAAFFSCPPEAIVRFLNDLRARHGGVRLYLGDIGVERQTIEAVRDNLLEG